MSKIFEHYIDIEIFALGYFILTHPVITCVSDVSGSVNLVLTKVTFL